MSKTTRRLIKYLTKYKLYLIITFSFAIIGNVLLLIGPLLLGRGIDKIVGKGNVDFKGLLGIVMLLIGVYLLSSLFLWIMGVCSSISANKTIYDIRKDAFEKLNTLPLKYFDNNSHGDIISRLTNDIDTVTEGLFQGITQIMSAIVIVIGTFIFMLTISPIITLIVVVITPICFLSAFFIAKMSNKMFRKQSSIVGELNGYVEEIIGNQKTVKAFGYEQRAFNKFESINKRLNTWGQKAQFFSALTNPTTRFINNIAFVSVTVVGSLFALNNILSIGKIVSFLTYSNQFAKPINEMTSIASQFQSAITSAERIFLLLDETPEEEGENRVISSCEGNIEFKNVSFSYRKDVTLIDNLCLDVSKGQTVAIVGKTGAGKTTLINLLMRFYNIDNGHIIIDDTNIYSINKDSLRHLFGMVLQDSWIFRGTVAENITYGKPDADIEEIIEAAKSAYVHNFIKRLSHGYDTIIDEDGGNLSEGQKQLITIARIMLMNPPMLILDEATSNIDTRTEIKIRKAFNTMMKGRTSFVIAHRLSTIREADIILVMKDGNIVEQGSHDELIKASGFYYTLYNSQFTDY